MPKKFKTVKWDDKKQFRKAIKQFKLSNATNQVIDAVATDNIVTKTFSSLLKEKGMKYKKFTNNTKLMKLYTVFGILEFIKTDNKEKIVQDLDAAIKKLGKGKNFLAENIQEHNFEADMVKGYALSDDEVAKFFSNNDKYNQIALIFSNPFNDQQYYDFAYLLAMYVSLEGLFNKYNIPTNYNIYLIKIAVQLKMIEILTYISPANFNKIIIKLDAWFKKYDKKFYKLFSKKVGE